MPTNQEVEKIVEELCGSVTSLFPQTKIKAILFGSYARGDAEPGSDIDVLILVDALPFCRNVEREGVPCVWCQIVISLWQATLSSEKHRKQLFSVLFPVFRRTFKKRFFAGNRLDSNLDNELSEKRWQHWIKYIVNGYHHPKERGGKIIACGCLGQFPCSFSTRDCQDNLLLSRQQFLCLKLSKSACTQAINCYN